MMMLYDFIRRGGGGADVSLEASMRTIRQRNKTAHIVIAACQVNQPRIIVIEIQIRAKYSIETVLHTDRGVQRIRCIARDI